MAVTQRGDRLTVPATSLDASAFGKLAIEEPQSDALRRYLRRRRPLVPSALARAAVLRARQGLSTSQRTVGARPIRWSNVTRLTPASSAVAT